MEEVTDLIRSMIDKELPIGTKDVRITDFNRDLKEIEVKCKLSTLQNVKLKISINIKNI